MFISFQKKLICLLIYAARFEIGWSMAPGYMGSPQSLVARLSLLLLLLFSLGNSQFTPSTCPARPPCPVSACSGCWRCPWAVPAPTAQSRRNPRQPGRASGRSCTQKHGPKADTFISIPNYSAGSRKYKISHIHRFLVCWFEVIVTVLVLLFVSFHRLSSLLMPYFDLAMLTAFSWCGIIWCMKTTRGFLCSSTLIS